MKSWLRLSVLLILAFAVVFAILSSLPKQTSFEDSATTSADFSLTNDPEGTRMIDWRILRTLNFESGEMGAELKALDDKIVKIPGFMVPLDDYQANVTEFLLVPSAQACIHVPPPPPNQMIYVKMQGKRETKTAYGAIWLIGKLSLSPSQSPYGKVSFTMEGMGVRPYVSARGQGN